MEVGGPKVGEVHGVNLPVQIIILISRSHDRWGDHMRDYIYGQAGYPI